MLYAEHQLVLHVAIVPLMLANEFRTTDCSVQMTRPVDKAIPVWLTSYVDCDRQLTIPSEAPKITQE